MTAGNLEVIDELVADDISDHAEGLPGQPSGKEGVKFFVTTLWDVLLWLGVLLEDVAFVGATLVGVAAVALEILLGKAAIHLLGKLS